MIHSRASAYAQNLEAALLDEGNFHEDPLDYCWSTVRAAINGTAIRTAFLPEAQRIPQPFPAIELNWARENF